MKKRNTHNGVERQRGLWFLLSLLLFVPAHAQDIMPDAWVGRDALAREMPTSKECPLKTDGKPRTVGIFYVTWHTQTRHNGRPYDTDVTRILAADSTAARQWEHPLWTNHDFHWGEPEYGYFLSQDRYVIRHDMSMLADAGVDVIIFDVTNAVLYWDEWDVILDEMTRMKAEGNRVPQFCFWAFNGNVITVVTEIYERIYKQRRSEDLWFQWQGKPLLLCNATPWMDANVGGGEKNAKDYPQEVKDFFTLRNMWWGYYTWGGERYVGGEDKWSFGYDMHMEDVQKLTPLERASRHNGEVEEMAVTPAQHPITNVGKCWRPGTGEPALNGQDMPTRTFVPATGKEEADPVRWGIYFQDRWDEALQVDPPFIYLNDWNEWVAGRYVSGKDPGGHVPGPTGFIGRENPFYFVDQYNAEFNRTIQPMRGGYTDNYYMQMVQNIRRYKGVRPSPVQSHYATQLRIDGRFDDWADVECVYRDTRGDVIHRNHPGYGTAVYTDNTGRNDIVLCRAATDRRNAYFYVETAAALTPHTDRCWMLLYIDLDADPTTGWQGYDLLVRGYDPQVGTVGVYIYDKENGRFADLPRLQVPCAIGEKQIELAIPLRKVGVKDKEVFFDFKWTDNARDPYDLISISTTGDTAPNRRFAYRFGEKGAGKGPSFARARTK